MVLTVHIKTSKLGQSVESTLKSVRNINYDTTAVSS